VNSATPTSARHNAPAFDVETIRAEFPILATTVHGKPLVFLDSGASAQKPRCVIDAISQCYETRYANIHRGVYYLSQVATEAYEGARAKRARSSSPRARPRRSTWSPRATVRGS
jgi:selenocysteine lyase/cysteine desulfurase